MVLPHQVGFQRREISCAHPLRLLTGAILNIVSGYGSIGWEETITVRQQVVPPIRFRFRAGGSNRALRLAIRQLSSVRIVVTNLVLAANSRPSQS